MTINWHGVYPVTTDFNSDESINFATAAKMIDDLLTQFNLD